MKYLSIDIETGGLEPQVHSILEVGAVLDDLSFPGVPVEKLPRFRLLVFQQNYVVTPYCAKLHTKLWEEMERRKNEVKCPDHCDWKSWLKPNEMGTTFANFDAFTSLAYVGSYLHFWLEQNGMKPEEQMTVNDYGQPMKDNRIKITAAGKNFSKFDDPFLRCKSDFKMLDVRHRVIDVATHFWQPGDAALPDTNTCLKRAGIQGETDHTAISDCLNVCRLVRKVMSEPFETKE